MSCQFRRHLLPIVLLAFPGAASALGLGELRGQPVLGEPLSFEVGLLGADLAQPEAGCFRLVQPAGQDDLPWLNAASFSVRRGPPPTLEVRSHLPLNEPVLQVVVSIGCGHAVSRSYVLMASPRLSNDPEPSGKSAIIENHATSRTKDAEPGGRVRFPAALPTEKSPSRKPLAARRSERIVPAALGDRQGLAGDSRQEAIHLRTARQLSSAPRANETQREILRLEYRLLTTLHEQATSQIATVEKLHQLEGRLADLQQNVTAFAQRSEAASSTPAPEQPPPSATLRSEPGGQLPKPSPQPASPPPPADEAAFGLISEWGIIGTLIGVALGLIGWSIWRRRVAKLTPETDAASLLTPASHVEPSPLKNHQPGDFTMDLAIEPVTPEHSQPADIDLDTPDHLPESISIPFHTESQTAGGLSALDASDLSGGIEVNPVMELADIMLSFGRVKGAAQALQEYIDDNPQEALQPWIRLLDVYRLAGMREEFEAVAHNLNQNFNVEVQNWERDGVAYANEPGTLTPAPSTSAHRSLEDLPRLMNTVIELWPTGDVVGYLYQLLRDNRGGKRQGFALPVVEDIVFLIELKETANRLES